MTEPMKSDYLDVLLMGMMGLAALVVYFHVNREPKSRLVPAKIRRKENSPVTARCSCNQRW